VAAHVVLYNCQEERDEVDPGHLELLDILKNRFSTIVEPANNVGARLRELAKYVG